MDFLPLEVLGHIVTYLKNVEDVVSFRSTCKKLRDASFFAVRSIEWPREHYAVSLPWTPKSLKITRYTPATLVSVEVPVISCTFANFNRISRSAFINVTSLTLEHVFDSIDLRELLNLRSLTVTKMPEFQFPALQLPKNVTKLVLQEVIISNLTDCTQLHTVEMKSCIRPTNIRPFATANTLHFTQMELHDIGELVHVNNISLVLCTVVRPAVLYCETLNLVKTEWDVYPDLPNVRNLSLYEYNQPTIRQEDIARCTSIKAIFEQPTEISDTFCITNFEGLTHLSLNLCFVSQKISFPAMPVLETLWLAVRDIDLPLSAPMLRRLTLSRMFYDIVVEHYPQLCSATILHYHKQVIVRNLPELKSLILHTESKRVTVENVPKLHTFVYRNQRMSHRAIVKQTRFEVGRLPLIRTFSIFNVSISGIHRLSRAVNVSLDHCNIIDPTELRALRNVPKLTLSACTGVTDASIFNNSYELELSNTDIDAVEHLPLARKLILIGCPISRINGVASLHTLNLDLTKVSDLSSLRNHQHLTHLSICDTPVADLSPLSTVSTLRSFLGNSCVNIIDANSLLHVRMIDLSDCVKLGAVEELYRCEMLDLRGHNCVSTDMIQFLAANIENFYYDDEDMDEATDDDMNLDMNGHENDGDQH